MTPDAVIDKIKDIVIDLNNKTVGQELSKHGNDAIEYGYCLYTDSAHPDYYFVISKLEQYKNKYLDQSKFNVIVFDKNGDEVPKHSLTLNLTEIVKHGNKICNIV